MKSRRYAIELTTTLVAYALVLIGSNMLLKHLEIDRPWRDLLALTPMIPAFLSAWVILRKLQRSDELQLRIQLEALGFSFAATALLTFSYGFLEGQGYPRLSMFLVWPVMATFWMVGQLLAKRRYR